MERKGEELRKLRREEAYKESGVRDEKKVLNVLSVF